MKFVFEFQWRNQLNNHLIIEWSSIVHMILQMIIKKHFLKITISIIWIMFRTLFHELYAIIFICYELLHVMNYSQSISFQFDKIEKECVMRNRKCSNFSFVLYMFEHFLLNKSKILHFYFINDFFHHVFCSYIFSYCRCYNLFCRVTIVLEFHERIENLIER